MLGYINNLMFVRFNGHHFSTALVMRLRVKADFFFSFDGLNGEIHSTPESESRTLHTNFIDEYIHVID